MKELINYRLQKRTEILEYGGGLYDYIFAANGTFVRGKRDGLDVQLLLDPGEVRGLYPTSEFFNMEFPKVNTDIMNQMFEEARSAEDTKGNPIEILFYLIWDEGTWGGEWKLVTPDQDQTAVSCNPVNKTDPDYQRCIIEVHSHHGMRAFFSGQDDKDETGFKIYAVLGEIFSKPTIKVRCGIYGNFMYLAADQVFDLPEWLDDGVYPPSADFAMAAKEELSASEKLGRVENAFQWLAETATEDKRYWPVLEFACLEGENPTVSIGVEDGDEAHPSSLTTHESPEGGSYVDTFLEVLEGAKPIWNKRFIKAVK